jgi:hypothetical protein
MVEEMLPKDPRSEEAPPVDSATDNDEDEIPELIDEDDLDFLDTDHSTSLSTPFYFSDDQKFILTITFQVIVSPRLS